MIGRAWAWLTGTSPAAERAMACLHPRRCPCPACTSRRLREAMLLMNRRLMEAITPTMRSIAKASAELASIRIALDGAAERAVKVEGTNDDEGMHDGR